jgi:hypothetical protein
VPDCYALVNLNPREPQYAREVADAVAAAIGISPVRLIIRFDEVRKKAHIFIPLEDEHQIADAIGALRDNEAILDYGLVARPSEVGVDIEDYPGSGESA